LSAVSVSVGAALAPPSPPPARACRARVLPRGAGGVARGASQCTEV